MSVVFTALDFFGWVLHNSRQASLLVIFILSAQFLFKKWLSPQWRLLSSHLLRRKAL